MHEDKLDWAIIYHAGAMRFDGGSNFSIDLRFAINLSRHNMSVLNLFEFRL